MGCSGQNKCYGEAGEALRSKNQQSNLLPNFCTLITIERDAVWQQINTNKLTKLFRLILELHIYGLVGVVTSLLVYFIEVNTAFPPPSPVFVGNGALSFSNVCGVFDCSFQFLLTSEMPAFKAYSTVL